jgi:hypothetical protein
VEVGTFKAIPVLAPHLKGRSLKFALPQSLKTSGLKKRLDTCLVQRQLKAAVPEVETQDVMRSVWQKITFQIWKSTFIGSECIT